MDTWENERVLRIDPERDRCCEWSAAEGKPASPETSLSDVLKTLSADGQIHTADQARVLDFLSPEHLRSAVGGENRRILCRRLTSGGNFRWNLLELLGGDGRACFLRIQDLHGVIRESRELEGLTPRILARLQWDAQIADILKSRFQIMNTVNLETGQCRRVALNAPFGAEEALSGDYATFINRALSAYVHPDDAEAYRRTLTLEHLRERAAATEEFSEETCVYRQMGPKLRWIELWVICARRDGKVTVNILGRDVTREKELEESSRQALEERAYIISSLSSLFFSTYYIDLESNTFRAVTQLRRVGDLLGEEVDFTAGIRIYANHFIHPDDREEYLRVMDCENLRASLRWWSPCVAIEYRRLPEIPGSGDVEWVRASAVLARSGADDLPRTAIYVAQSITDSRRRAL